MSARKGLNALDRSFLAGEGRDVMMHVGALMPFTPPKDGAARDFSRHLRQELKRAVAVQSPWNLKLRHGDLLSSPLQAWVEDERFDIEYPVRRSALARPGDERELGVLVSRLHSTPLDFHRPPWEVHFIEGLEGDRVAIYFKVHHSLVDGYTGMRMLVRSMSAGPDEDTPMFYTLPPLERTRTPEGEAPTVDSLQDVLREQLGAAKDAGKALINLFRANKGEENHLIAPLEAPMSILNQRITRSRRFATHQVPIDRLKKLAAAAKGTMNDVVLAICASALRKFLLEQDALPAQPLVAMLPVNVRPKDDPGGSGNAVGAILASLATDVADPAERIRVIIGSTTRAKEQLQGMSKAAIVQYGMLVMAPLMLSLVPGAVGRVRPAFNVVISNVPGPETPLHFRGYRLEATYPLSIPFHGYALNITVQSYAGTLNFGFIGCRDTLPHLQRLAVYCGEAVDELEEAIDPRDLLEHRT
ncbi:MAG: wax ester/triacylglycerol synthase family O-acyltransferase [Polyangiales bacterium]